MYNHITYIIYQTGLYCFRVNCHFINLSKHCYPWVAHLAVPSTNNNLLTRTLSKSVYVAYCTYQGSPERCLPEYRTLSCKYERNIRDYTEPITYMPFVFNPQEELSSKTTILWFHGHKLSNPINLFIDLQILEHLKTWYLASACITRRTVLEHHKITYDVLLLHVLINAKQCLVFAFRFKNIHRSTPKKKCNSHVSHIFLCSLMNLTYLVHVCVLLIPIQTVTFVTKLPIHN